MAYANPSTFVAGNVLTAAQQNVLANNDRFFHGVPSAKAYRAAQQVIPTGVWTAVTFDTERWDNDTIWSSTADERFKIRTSGKYSCHFVAGIAGSTVGTQRGVQIQVDSTANTATKEAARTLQIADLEGGAPSLAVADVFNLTSTQFVSFLIFQDSGGNLATSTALSVQPKASILWMSS